jgi:hypothetical protein
VWPLRLAFRLVQAVVLAVGSGAAVTGNLVLGVNALGGFLVTLFPWLGRRAWGIRLSSPIVLWLGVAVLFHTVGMAGWYETVWWWDHLTHTLSAALLAALADTGIRLLAASSDRITLPPAFRLVLVLVLTLAAGVLWEVMEFLGRMLATWYGHQPLLVQYGLADTVLDLAFDGLGALLGTVGLGWGDRGSIVAWTVDSGAASNRKTP